MTCTSCGYANPAGAPLCASCGAYIASPFAEAAGPEGEVTATSATGEAPRVYAGRFRLLEMVGKGGMGEVWRARDTTLGEDVAVKILPPFRPDEPDVERFKREIVTARRISHPNVMRVFEFGTQDRGGFISMELLGGGTLADRIASGPIPVPDAMRILLGIVEGLAAAHEAGIVHRDIKPQNVLFDAAGRPKIADFGLARLSDSTAMTVGFSGTPQYMSPEMADGREVTTKSDVYSFGVLLFETFTGRRPFIADTLVRLVMLHQNERPPSLRALRPEVPDAIETVYLAALEKTPADRPTAEEIVEALRAVGAGMPLPKLARRADKPVTAAALDTAPTMDPRNAGAAPVTERVSRSISGAKSPSRRGAILAAVGATAVVAAAAFAALEYGRAPAPAETPIAAATAAPSGTVEAATPTATATLAVETAPTPVTAVTELPRTTATPRPSPTKRVAVAATGTLAIRSFPWVKVVVDGVVVDEQTPMPPKKLSAGTHRVVLSNPAHKFSREIVVTIEAGKETTIVADPAAGTARVGATR